MIEEIVFPKMIDYNRDVKCNLIPRNPSLDSALKKHADRQRGRINW